MMTKLIDFPGGYGSPNQAVQLLEACAEKLANDKSDSASMFHAAMSLFETYGRQHILCKWADAKASSITDEPINLDSPIRSFLICTEQSGFESGWILFASLDGVSQYENRWIKHKVHTKSPVYVAITINLHGGAAVLRLGRVARHNRITDDSAVVGPMLRVALGVLKAINVGTAVIRFGTVKHGCKVPNTVEFLAAPEAPLDKPLIVC